MKVEQSRYPESFDLEKSNAITAAKQLFYGNEVINELRHAKDSDEIRRIMASARRRK